MAIMWDSGSQDAGSIPAGTTNTGLAQLVVALVSKTRGRRFEPFNPCKWSYGVGGCLLAGLKIQRPLFDSRCAHQKYGDMGKLVDPSRLERDAEMRVGSSPTIPTINNYRPRSS